MNLNIFAENVEVLCNKRGISKKQLLDELCLSTSSFVNWKTKIYFKM